MKNSPAGDNQANMSAARRMAHEGPYNTVRVLHTCGNCGKAPATALVGGKYFRCDPCANHLISLWAEMRSES